MNNSTVAEIPDHELLRRAVNGARGKRSRAYIPRWVAVMELFALGSTFSKELCQRYSLNPDELVRP